MGWSLDWAFAPTSCRREHTKPYPNRLGYISAGPSQAPRSWVQQTIIRLWGVILFSDHSKLWYYVRQRVHASIAPSTTIKKKKRGTSFSIHYQQLLGKEVSNCKHSTAVLKLRVERKRSELLNRFLSGGSQGRPNSGCTSPTEHHSAWGHLQRWGAIWSSWRGTSLCCISPIMCNR